VGAFYFIERRQTISIDLGPANHHAALCISRVRWLSLHMRYTLRKDGIWEDLMQELLSAAFEAWKSGMDDAETRRFAQRRLYAFLKSYGFRLYLGGWHRCEKTLESVYPDMFDRGVAPRDNSPVRLISRRDDHLDEKILALLRKHSEGLTRWKLSTHFQVPVWEVSSYLAPMIKKGEVIEIKRESTRGRPPTPLFFIAGATIPEEKNFKEERWKNVKKERDERIRQAYFMKGWSIKRINRELHHDKRTIRRALNRNEAIPWLSR